MSVLVLNTLSEYNEEVLQFLCMSRMFRELCWNF